MIDTGNNQGRTGPSAEGCRRITCAVHREMWPFYALFAVWVLLGLVFGT